MSHDVGEGAKSALSGATLLWSATAGEEALATIAERVLAALGGSRDEKEAFCLWLIGGLGAGKTALTRALLRRLGLPAAVRVTSPTFTYVNEYEIQGAWYAHLDLYRADAAFSAEDVGLVDSRDYRGYIVEWPTAVPATPILTPSHRLDISFAEGGQARRYELYACKSPG